MHVISRKSLKTFWSRHPKSKEPLCRWFKIVQKTSFSSFGDLRATFPSVDKVGNVYVFNIGGNNYRLIAAVHFNRGKLYVRHVLTHREYDKGDWMR